MKLLDISLFSAAPNFFTDIFLFILHNHFTMNLKLSKKVESLSFLSLFAPKM